jgi:diadenylate cyclase
MQPTKEEQRELLGKLAPGTPLRLALDRIVQFGRGALIVLAPREKAERLIAAGFELNAPFTPEALAELAKMDRAVVLDPELRTILYANAHLVPDPKIPSRETGTRHRVAEQVAKELFCPVIAVSEERRRVTLYFGDWRYELPDPQALLERVGQALSILERYRRDLREMLRDLGRLELERRVLPVHVASVLHRFLTIFHLEEEISRMLVELGELGELSARHLSALIHGIREEFFLFLRDYVRDPRRSPEEIGEALLSLEEKEAMNPEKLLSALGLDELDPDIPLAARGYRILSKIPRLPPAVVERLVEEAGSIDQIARLSRRQLTRIKGIAETRARAIQYGLARVREGYTFSLEGF